MLDLKQFLEHIINENVNCAHLGLIDIPEVGAEDYEQGANWWWNIFRVSTSRTFKPGSYVFCYNDFERWDNHSHLPEVITPSFEVINDENQIISFWQYE